MGGDSFERGGKPRSVPDPDGEAYNAMIRRHRQMMAQRESDGGPARGASQHGHPPQGPIDAAASNISHILNGPREARHQVERGQIVRGLIDGATAAADLELGRSIMSGVRRGAVKVSGSNSWRQTRKWLGEKGFAAKGQHAHHALIPNNGWGKSAPNIIKNQPWNLKMTESPVHHIRIHGASRKFGLPQFNALERYWHGTPTWWKAANGAAVGHSVQATVDHFPQHRQTIPPHHLTPKK